MFLENFNFKEAQVTKLHMQSTTYKAFYNYWVENLFERVTRLFVWENTYEVVNNKVVGVKPKEIEQRLLMAGHCGITKILKQKEVTAMWGNFFGIGKYEDEKPNYMVRCPLYSGERTIGKDIVVIDNCSLRNPLYPLVHHYATLLAHNEVTLAHSFVRLREAGGIPIAKTEKQKQSITAYQTKTFNGEFGSIMDMGMFGVDYAGNGDNSSQAIMDLMDTRAHLIKSFYSDIGVRSAFEKRSNSVEAEVEADTSLLLINVSDMIASREEGADRVNKMFGTNWQVHIAEEINYTVENAREGFSSNDEYHEHEIGEGSAEDGNND